MEENTTMSFSQLAKEIQAMKAPVQEEIPVREKKSAEEKWELTMVSYPDFVVTKSTARQQKMLVFMPSCEGYYIKTLDSKGNQTEIKELTRESYAAFTSKMESITMPEGFWIAGLAAGVATYDLIHRYLSTPGMIQMLKEKVAPTLDTYLSSSCRAEPYLTMFKLMPSIYKKNFGDKMALAILTNQVGLFADLQRRYGLEKVQMFLDEAKNSIVGQTLAEDYTQSRYNNFRTNESYWITGAYNGTYTSPLPLNVSFSYENLKNFIIYTSVAEGYADNFTGFMHTWRDTLSMQMDLYGSYREKYPEHMTSYHHQLAYQTRLHKKEVDMTKFTRQSERTKAFEAKVGQYVFIAPEKPEDFDDEAVQMHHCIASYKDKYINGNDHILFMRKADKPQVSVVTIELNADGNTVIQAYQQSNKMLSTEQKDVLAKWCEKYNINPGIYTIH